MRVLLSAIVTVVVCVMPRVGMCRDGHAIHGGFSMNGYVDVAAGWQRFSNDNVTEIAQDGSFAGPLGELIPDVQNGTVPRPGQDYLEFTVQMVEFDMVKDFGDRTRVRADLQFGRAASGSSIAGVGVALEHAYAQVVLWEPNNVRLTMGRFGLQAGFEPYESYLNDTISWSILWRGLIALGVTTGVQLSADVTDNLSVYLAASNGFIRDVVPDFARIPSFIGSTVFSWGPQDQGNSFVFSAFGGPEANNNDDFYVGCDAYVMWWFHDRWELGLESTFQHHQATDTGPATNYIGNLVNLHWDVTQRLYTVMKYAHAWQSDRGNAFINLTGARQHIHEISVGGGYYVADTAKFKFEWRTDIVDPAAGATQVAYGAVIGFAYAF